MTELYNLKRNTLIDVSHLYLLDKDKNHIKTVKFLNLDTFARCEYKGEVFLMYATTKVKEI